MIPYLQTILLFLLAAFFQPISAQIYYHDFDTLSISGSPYSQAPVTLDSSLSNSSWVSSTGNFTSYAGSAGLAIALSNSGGTPTMTLSFDVDSGYNCSIDSFRFWRMRSSTGAQNWALSINSVSVGSGTVPTSGTNIGNTAVSSPISNLTGTVSVVITLSGASGTGTFRLDDFTLFGTVQAIVVNANDTNSNLRHPAVQVAASNPTSLADSLSEAFNVLRFTMVDSASGDAIATHITNIRLFPAAANTADWTDHIAGVAVDRGGSISIGTPIISDASLDIPISVGNLSITDGDTAQITVGVFLNQSNIADNAVLAFRIDADNHGFTSDTSGSGLSSILNGGSDITGNNHTIQVVASKVGFVQQPTQTSLNSAMSPAVTVSCNDANGNRDTDYVTSVALTSTGTLSGSPLSEVPASGLATFSSLTHTSTGNGLRFTANSGTLDSALSDTFGIITPPQEGLSVSAFNTLYAITFDGTVSGVNQGQFSGSGMSSSPASGQINSLGLSIAGMSDGSVSFGASNTSGDFARGNASGGVSTGGMYAFEVSSGNKALGFQPTSTDFANGTVILKVQNNTGDTLKNILFSYDLYVFNDQDRSTLCEVSFSTDNSTYNQNDTLTFFTDTLAMTSAAWRRNTATQHISGLNLADGAYYYIKWSFTDNGGSGSRDEFAIDNIRFIGYKDTLSNGDINAALSGSYVQLIVNSGTGLSAVGNLTVYKSLKFFKGNLTLNNFNLTLGDEDADATVSGADSASFLIPGTGTLRYYVNNTSGTYLFPYGSGSNYTPAQVVFTAATLSGSDYLESTMSDQKHPNFSGYVSNFINRNWTIESSGITSPAYNLTLSYADGDVNGVESSILPVKYASGTWTAPSNIGNNNVDTVGTGAVDLANNRLTWSGLNGFSIFGGAGNGTPLPLQLLFFEGRVEAGRVSLFWRTSEEDDLSHFVVESADDRQSFNEIGSVAAQNISSLENEYSFIDPGTLSSLKYYRLRMVDNNGAYTFSNVIFAGLASDARSVPFDIILVQKEGAFFLKLQGLRGQKVHLDFYNQWGLCYHSATEYIRGEALLPIQNTLSRGLNIIKAQSGNTVRILKVPGY
jgi:hypothetical protein